jgi:hypothetical protein
LKGARAIFRNQRWPSALIIEVFDARHNTDKSEGIREVLERYGYSLSLHGESLAPFSGHALNAYALHASALPQVLAKFSPPKFSPSEVFTSLSDPPRIRSLEASTRCWRPAKATSGVTEVNWLEEIAIGFGWRGRTPHEIRFTFEIG